MNRQRAAHSLPALQMSTALISSARRHNLAMARANTLSHQLPGEPVFTTRISQAGVAWHSAAENVGYTTNRTSAGSESLQTAMYNEVAPNDGHRRNILSTAVHYVGVDVYLDAATGKLWLTEDFADVPGPAAKPAAVVAPHNPVGMFDSAVVQPGHKLLLSGWAYDPDNTLLSLHIDVYVDGKFAGRFFNPTQRPDVAGRRHVGQWTGYRIVITVPAGRHTVGTYALNVGPGSSVRLANKVVAA